MNQSAAGSLQKQLSRESLWTESVGERYWARRWQRRRATPVCRWTEDKRAAIPAGHIKSRDGTELKPLGTVRSPLSVGPVMLMLGQGMARGRHHHSVRCPPSWVQAELWHPFLRLVYSVSERDAQVCWAWPALWVPKISSLHVSPRVLFS